MKHLMFLAARKSWMSYFLGLSVAVVTFVTVEAFGQVMFDGVQCVPLGQAIISTSGAGLQVANISSSGNDGVRLLFPNGIGTPGAASLLDLQLASMGAASSYPVGAFLQETQWGTINGSPNQAIAHLRATANSGGSLNINVDMSPMAPASLDADYYLQGVKVGSESGISPIATTTAWSFWPNDATGTIEIIPIPPFVIPDIEFSWILAENIDEFGGGTVAADDLHFSPVGSVNTFGGYSAIDLTGSQIGQFTITSIPEPATLLLFGLGGLALFRRQRG